MASNRDRVHLNFLVPREFVEMLDEIIEIRPGSNRTEIFRLAVYELHRKIRPAYLEPSAREQEKLQKQKELKQLEEMTPEEYAREVMKGYIATTKDGSKYVCLMTSSNNTRITPLATIKEFDEADSYFRETHLAQLGQHNFDEWLIQYGKYALSKIGMTPEEVIEQNRQA